MTWTPLKRVADVWPSNVDKLTVEDEHPVRLVNYTDVYYGDRLHPELDLMNATATPSEIAKFRLQRGDVILTKDSETADDIGISAYVDEASPDMVCGYHLSLVRPRNAVGRYLHYAISSTHARQQMNVAATGVTRFGLRAESVGALSLWLPPLAEQRAIADYLYAETTRIDALITKKQQLIHLLEERIRVAADEIVDSLLKDCELVPLKYEARESDERLGPGRTAEVLAVSIHHGVVPRADIDDRPSRADNFEVYKVCRPGQIVLNRMRGIPGRRRGCS